MIHDLPKNLVEDSRKLLQQGADYEKFFKAALKKFGVNSPADFKSDEDKKKFFDYIDKNYKGEKEEQVQEADADPKKNRFGFVFFDQGSAKSAAKAMMKHGTADVTKTKAGMFQVLFKGDDKKAVGQATRIALKYMGEEVDTWGETLDEAKKSKYKSKGMSKISQGIKKIVSIEKKMGADVKDIQAVEKFLKSGLETEMYDDMEVLTPRSLKQLDKLMSKIDTDPRDGIAAAIEKADPDLYDMMFGY